jgi:hypothetical protein
LMDDKWNSASNDVFDYNAKGENLWAQQTFNQLPQMTEKPRYK